MFFVRQMSMEGVRVLAKALQENVSRGVSHVYVHNEGRIDALARQRGEDIKNINTEVTMLRVPSESRSPSRRRSVCGIDVVLACQIVPPHSLQERWSTVLFREWFRFGQSLVLLTDLRGLVEHFSVALNAPLG